METRDRLIELINTDVECTKDGHGDCSICEYQYADDECAKYYSEVMADFFLANGIIVPPCKVGDKVYVISETRVKETKVLELHIDSQNHITIFVVFECDDDCEGCPFEAWSQSFCGEWDCGNQYGAAEIKEEGFGKTVFLTKEEAEAKLGICKMKHKVQKAKCEQCEHCKMITPDDVII